MNIDVRAVLVALVLTALAGSVMLYREARNVQHTAVLLRREAIDLQRRVGTERDGESLERSARDINTLTEKLCTQLGATP